MKTALKVLLTVTLPVWYIPAVFAGLFMVVALDAYDSVSDSLDKLWPERSDD